MNLSDETIRNLKIISLRIGLVLDVLEDESTVEETGKLNTALIHAESEIDNLLALLS